MANNPARKSKSVYLIRASLQDISPEIWRTVLVPGDYTLAYLHVILQTVMNWLDYHLHQFEIGGKTYGRPDYDEDGEDLLDERAVRLRDVITADDEAFFYSYDFGDGWQMELKIEQVVPHDAGTLYPQCVGGGRSAPPEDIGGVPGYEQLLEAIANPSDEEHRELLEWVGETFDAEEFDSEFVNLELRKIFRLLD